MNKPGEVTGVEPTNGNPKAIMTTATGGHFNFDDMLSSDFSIVDIAHSLSNMCRFNGHTREFYSVAEHSFMCVEYLRKRVEEDDGELKISNQTYMYALLHDAAEAFISDIPKPFKQTIDNIEQTEKAVFDAIITKLELDLDEADLGLVAQADKYMVLKEAKDLLNPSRQFKMVWAPWITKYHEAYREMMDDEGTEGELWISNFSPDQAAKVFLDEFNKIKWGRI